MINAAKKIGTIAVSAALVAGISFPASILTSKTAYADPTAEEQASIALEQLNSLQEQLGSAENEYNAAVMDKETAEQKIQEAQAKIDECNQQIAETQDKLGTRARSMYRTGSSTILDLILGATSFEEFSNNWSLLELLNSNDTNLVNTTKSLREELDAQKATLEENKKIAEEKEATAAASMSEAQSLVTSQQAVYDSLSEEAAKALEEQQAAQDAANQSAAVAAIENNTSSTTTNNSAAETTTTDTTDTTTNDTYVDNSSNTTINNNTTTNDSKAQSVDGGSVVGRAYAEIGKPYVWGGVGPDGYDCSGFVSYCLTGSHIRLGTTGTFMGWTQVSNPQPGDVCVNSYHTGIYIGGGMMIHSATYGIGVTTSAVFSDMIYVRY